MNSPSYVLFCPDSVWLEGVAVDQFKQTAALPGMVHGAGMPDLHPGKGHPIGAAFLTRDCLYPYLIGNDIGCGMGFWQSSLKHHKLKRDKLFKKLQRGLPMESDGLGSVGGGNHFVELQLVESVLDSEDFEILNLERDSVYLLVHSGSRGLGAEILREHVQRFKNASLKAGSPEAGEYLRKHDWALAWAKENRRALAASMLGILGGEGRLVSDNVHNSLLPAPGEENVFIHRKGAAAADQGVFVLAGSRGTHSYLVKPVNVSRETVYSLAHGAGRKWNRRQTRERLHNRWRKHDLVKTDLGSFVVCHDKELLYEEAPQAYKNIDAVLAALVKYDLVRPVAKLCPILTYKSGGGR